MAGARTWVGFHKIGFFPVQEWADTTHYEVVILNDSMVQILTDTIRYYYPSADSNAIIYKKAITWDNLHEIVLTYYYKTDSMVYDFYSRWSTCCFDQEVLHTIH